MSKYLIDDQPLIVLPKLAQKVGLNESLFLQQLHYWLLQKRNIRDGYYWAFNSYPEWLKQFPFWSESTLKRTVTSLEKSGLVITGNYNSMKIDKTKWYRIDYKILKEITSDIEEFDGKASNDESVQNDTTSGSKRTNEGIDLNRPIPKITTKTTTDNLKDNIPAKADTIPYQEIIEYLNLKTGKNFKHKTRAHRKFIKDRWEEGNTFEEFKIVIDKMVCEWTGTEYQNYLQPSTLFGNKFENYLNKTSFKFKQNNKQYQKQDAMSMMLEQLNLGGYENEQVNERRRDQLLISEDGSTL